MARKPKRKTIQRKTMVHSTVASPIHVEPDTVDMNCKECGRLVMDVSGLKAVTCSYCVMGMIDPPQQKVKPEEVRPRGWQFMTRYVSPSGKVYSKGKEIDESIQPPKKPSRAKTSIPKAKPSPTDAGKRKPVAKRGAKRGK